MSTKPISIRSVGDYYAEASDKPIDFKPLVLEHSGRHVRRITRFIQLALIGAGKCVGQASLPENTAVYLASGSGDIGVASDVMAEMLRDSEAVRPLSFVNAVSNSACFYIAKRYGLKAQSCFVSRTHASFQAALELASLDMTLGRVESALVGGVDIVGHPLELHWRRLKLEHGTPVGEGSHWLWLSTEEYQGPKLETVRFFSDHGAMKAWLNKKQSQAMSDEVIVIENHLQPRAFYPTRSSAVVSDFLNQSSKQTTMIHIQGDGEGRFAAIEIRR